MSLIHEQIPKIMAAIGAIGKTRKNLQQGYMFRGIDDVYSACQSALAEHGVFTVPRVLNIAREERASKGGGVLIYTMLTMQYTFFASDGSSIEAVTVGEGMDSGDKSANKSMSAAQKYALLQVFAIPTDEAKDSENQSPELAGREPQSASRQTPADVRNYSPQAASISGPDAVDLRARVQAAGMNEAIFLKTFGAASFTDFPADKLAQANAMLAKKQKAGE